MKEIFHKNREFWSQRALLISVLSGISLLIISLVVNYFANIYTNLHTSNPVGDLILDNLPVVNVNFVFFEGFALFLITAIFIGLKDPKKISFAIKSIALFILIRSVFITLTHLAPPVIYSDIEFHSFLSKISGGNDMFFSSHTSLPYLLALVFWENKSLRIFFIFASIVFAISVLLGHLHYSIDVFAAYFITYTIFHLSQKFFARDYEVASSTS